MFIGPLEEMKPWSTHGVEGVYRFLNRVWRLYVDDQGALEPALLHGPVPEDLERLYHETVKKVGEDIEALRFNTAISQMMILVNEITKQDVRPLRLLEPFILLLSPFAPHIAEELWQRLGHRTSIAYEQWPQYDERKIARTMVEVVLQVNGKVRSKIAVAVDTPDHDLEALSLSDDAVRRSLDGKKLVKTIVVRNKLVNLVAH